MTSKIIVNQATKDELISQQLKFKKTSYEMAQHIAMPSRSIRRFKEKRAKGKLIYAKDGRPPSIDAISEEAITDWINENPGYNRTMLQAIIWQECEATFMRKHPLYINNDRRKKKFASRHTVYRWYKHFTVFDGILF